MKKLVLLVVLALLVCSLILMLPATAEVGKIDLVQQGYNPPILTKLLINIVDPNGGETWQRGSTHYIHWWFSGIDDSNVKIELLWIEKKGTIPIIHTTTLSPSYFVGYPRDGYYTWNIPQTQTPGNYWIKVTSLKLPYINDTSDHYFTITAPAITVTTPNGGESWQRGSPHTVMWDYAGSLGPIVKIVLLKAGSEVGTINPSCSTGTSGKGSCLWTISSTRAPGTDYQVSVQSILFPFVRDTSNTYFTITSDETTPSITVTSPKAGDVWQPGTTHTVTWISTGAVGSNVKVVLLKAGAAVGTATARTANDGSHDWAISSGRTPGTDYQIQVESTTTGIKGTSSMFTIGQPGPTQASITVISPNGGEIWKRGTTQTIKWSFTGNPGSYVKIELLQGGTSVGTATYSSSIGSGGTGSYPWAISSTRAPGTNYRIRITSVSQPTISDTSNSDFTITA